MGIHNESKMAGAGKSRVRPRTQQRDRQDSEFINVELTLEQTSDYRRWREDVEDVFIVLDEAVNSGYKFTLKYDDYSSSFAVFMFPPPGHDNDGYILTGRGGSTFRALAEVLYKHRRIFADVWLNASVSGSPSDDPDW